MVHLGLIEVLIVHYLGSRGDITKAMSLNRIFC